MKKVLALVLALVLVLSLAACGGGNNGQETQETTMSSTDIKEYAFGKWECTVTSGNKWVKTVELFEGGRFSYSLYNATKKEYSKQDVTGDWSIVDGCIKLVPDFIGPLKPDYENGTLVDVTDKTQVYSKK